MTLERLVGPNANGFARSRKLFLRKIGGSVEDRLARVVTGKAERSRKR